MKKLNNKRMNVYDDRSSIHAPVPRIYRRKKHGRKAYRILVKCGDCDRKIDIYPDCEGPSQLGLIEIGGVLAHKDHWIQIFKEAGIL